MSTLNKVSQQSINWSSIVLNPVFLAQLDAMASKRFVQQVLAEEAVTSIIESLSENNWQRLQSFSGKSQASTFVYSVATRAMEDFARKKFGRPRPPTWLKEMGHAWVKLWRMLCLERQWPELIKTKLQDDFKSGFIDEAIKTIKQRLPRCGEAGFSQSCISELGLETLPDVASQKGLDEQIASAQHAQVLLMLSEMLQGTANEENTHNTPNLEVNINATNTTNNTATNTTNNTATNTDKLSVCEDSLGTLNYNQAENSEPSTVQPSIAQPNIAQLNIAQAAFAENKKAQQQNCPSNVSSLFNTLQTQLNLSAQDQLILALTFEDGQSSRKVATVLDVSPAFIQRRLKAIKQSFKECLAANNISFYEASDDQ